MPSLNSVVSITIDRQTKFPTRVGFGIPLILHEDTNQAENVIGTYEDLDGMIQDGFDTTDPSYKMATAIFSQNPRPGLIAVARRNLSESVVDALTRIRELYDDWYFLLMTSRVEQDILDASGYIETLPKMYFAASDDEDSADLAFGSDTTSLAAVLKAANRDRTVLLWAPSAPIDILGQYPEAAWVGKIAPKDPGSVTWKFKNLNSITADVLLTTTRLTNLEAKNANVYVTIAGIDQTQQGVCVSGEFIDIIRGTDKLSRRIQESVFTVLTQEDKVPYTDAGGQVLGASVQDPIDEAIDDGLLAGGDERPLVEVPKIEDIPQAQRALREFGDIEFEGRYAGAVHKVTIAGRITV